jgi:hypothetical protein
MLKIIDALCHLPTLPIRAAHYWKMLSISSSPGLSRGAADINLMIKFWAR